MYRNPEEWLPDNRSYYFFSPFLPNFGNTHSYNENSIADSCHTSRYKPLKPPFFSSAPSYPPTPLSSALQKGLLASIFRARTTPNPANRGTLSGIPKTLVPHFREFVPHRYPEWLIGARSGPGWDRGNESAGYIQDSFRNADYLIREGSLSPVLTFKSGVPFILTMLPLYSL